MTQSKFKGRLGGIFFLKNSKGISVLFLFIAMLLMVVIGYVFSYLIPTKQKSVLFPIQSNQAFFIAQSGAEFAVRYAKNQVWTTTTLLNNLNGITRDLGSGRFTLTYNYATYGDKLISVGEVPIGTEKRKIVVSNFTSFLCFLTYRKSITVQSGQVSNGPHTNFPMLVSMTDPDLRTTAYGGDVASYDAGTNDPRDIIFRALDDTTCGGSGTAPCTLDHEIEKYVASTGELVAWVRLPSINNGTVIYTYYGNSCMPSSTQNASGVWNSNYKGVWHLKEDPSGTAPQMKDSTANANHGTSNGTMTSSDQVAGQIDGSLDFDGSNDYIEIPSISAMNYVTISTWIKTTQIPGANGAQLIQRDYSDGRVWQFRMITAGKLEFIPFNTANANGDAVGTTAFNDGNWHHITATWDGTTIRIYVDGVAGGTANFSGTLNTAQKVTQFGKPNGNWTGGNYFLGLLDEVRISNVARSAGWIQTEYNNQKPNSTFYSVGLEECSP